ncbi:MAG: SIS domain-containing protein [Spirochaetales bacterium]|nr:SIS domain-containing protein [Spirochaetales bacterium]
MIKDFSKSAEAYLTLLKSTIDLISREEISRFLNILLDALESEKNIYIMGNGGSAATASHFAVDFNKGLSYGKEKRFRFICLNDNLPTLTAYANDVGYEDVFVEPLRNFLVRGEVVIGISGSGNSRNVLKAIEYANKQGALTVGITGFDGGALRKMAQYSVHIPIHDMQVTEDLHMVLDHLSYAVLGEYLPHA